MKKGDFSTPCGPFLNNYVYDPHVFIAVEYLEVNDEFHRGGVPLNHRRRRRCRRRRRRPRLEEDDDDDEYLEVIKRRLIPP